MTSGIRPDAFEMFEMFPMAQAPVDVSKLAKRLSEVLDGTQQEVAEILAGPSLQEDEDFLVYEKGSIEELVETVAFIENALLAVKEQPFRLLMPGFVDTLIQKIKMTGDVGPIASIVPPDLALRVRKAQFEVLAEVKRIIAGGVFLILQEYKAGPFIEGMQEIENFKLAEKYEKVEGRNRVRLLMQELASIFIDSVKDFVAKEEQNVVDGSQMDLYLRIVKAALKLQRCFSSSVPRNEEAKFTVEGRICQGVNTAVRFIVRMVEVLPQLLEDFEQGMGNKEEVIKFARSDEFRRFVMKVAMMELSLFVDSIEIIEEDEEKIMHDIQPFIKGSQGLTFLGLAEINEDIIKELRLSMRVAGLNIEHLFEAEFFKVEKGKDGKMGIGFSDKFMGAFGQLVSPEYGQRVFIEAVKTTCVGKRLIPALLTACINCVERDESLFKNN